MSYEPSVLVIGGGTNGVEVATEIKTGKVGLITRGPCLLPGLPRAAGLAAEEYLRNNDIELFLNTELP